MKTGTDVHKAIDMAVVMCLSEKMHYQLSNLSPPTKDWGAGVRRPRRWKGKMPKQPEAGMCGAPSGRRVVGQPGGEVAGQSKLRVSAQLPPEQWAGRWPGCGRGGALGDAFSVAIGSLLDKMKAPSTCNLNICFCENVGFSEMHGPEKFSPSTSIY